MTENQLLEQARLAKAGQYPVRSRHLDPDATPKFTNHLILEDSPYLLQHAHNPVNWYAYSDEAFALAERDNKPIFLSIGYATCHWCHVMEEECFDNLEVAAILNRDFISIKVDREQRPDLDDIYMTAAMLISGRGGWPLNSFLMPVRRLMENSTWQGAGNWFRKGAGMLIGLLGIYFVIYPFVSSL